MLKATILPGSQSSYVNAKGTTVFRYKVTGSPEELAAYAAAKGQYHRVDEKTGDVLFFSTTYAGDTVNLVITATGNVIPDMSEFRKAESLAKQFGGNLGEALANHSAGALLGKPSSDEQA
jgi:phosphopantetheinyl transferase